MDWGEIILTSLLDLILTVFLYLLVPVIFCIRKKPMTQKQIKKVIIINGVCVCLFFGILAGRVTAAVFLWSWVGKKIMERVLLVEDESDESKAVEQNEKVPSTAEQSESDNSSCSPMVDSPVVFDILHATKNQISFCRKCGNKLLEDAQYCSKCGTKVITDNQ